MNEVVELITSVGFPMVAAIVIYYDSRKDKDRLYGALDAFGDKLDNFDNTLKNIDKRIEIVEKELKDK